MPRRQSTPEPQNAELTAEQIRAVIPKLRNRIAELEKADINAVKEYGDPALEALEDKINTSLRNTFGPNTHAFQQYRIDLYGGPLYPEMPEAVVRDGYAKGVRRALAKLQGLIELFEEEVDSASEDPSRRAKRAFGELDLHPEIARVVTKLFEDGHYANAVENACKALDAIVKMRSRKFDLSGTELMQTVFSPRNPILAFNGLETETDKSEQQGMMFLYSGAMLALRNPRAHDIIEDDAEQAVEYIAFLSLLAKALDRTREIEQPRPS